MVAPQEGAHLVVGLVINVPRVLGIDEAGRGAVLGPLVVAGALAEGSARQRLRRLGAQDSKGVPRGRRQDILRLLAREVDTMWAVVIPARQVDGCSLTALEEQAISCMIHRLEPDRVVIDAPVGPNSIPALLGRLRSASETATEIDAYPRADVADPLVGAASLLAKVVRDGYMTALRTRYGDIGWGYPGEEKVRRFLSRWLAEHGALPPICRTRWASVQAMLSPRLPL